MSDRQTTYARAVIEYDEDHEKALLAAITEAIFNASKVTDCNAVVMRTGEAAEALVTVLAGVLAMSPTASRSPTAIRRTVDELGKRLHRRVAAAEENQDMQEFIRRTFRSGGARGST